ncbi:hypothetical protein TGAMA5MH_09585 [Trichoderma gamsii]|uniref:BRCT domain-containing protein n=1 Tax=Trichoderma gamsii TaxID=398673 RepID=A0A2K0SZ08_9HYPO|nr:hypothetical protein TGAMA5MH_09585 [Trichoderma gamsii]
MASPHSSGDENYGIDPSVPFKGVIVCCTDIPTDQRTDIAQKVAELGGVHKYDLTPDVTHLVVGGYDTPKYRHVARERVDIKAMDAGWIVAVSELWKKDEEIDLAALEKSYQLKPLETSGAEPWSEEEESPAARGSLLVCLTGFGEQRDKIAETVKQNGGRFTGDLTRRCTHLIVNKPEGKKFTAAKSWGVHTVTLDWLNQSVERGMILEEAKFDPLLPAEEQGSGAWVKTDPRRTSLGKRARSAILNGGPDEGARKLRKTASMKLSSQRNDLWGDILGRSASREYSFAHENPLKEETQAQAQARPAPTPTSEVPTQPGYSLQEDQGVFANCTFFIHGFPTQRASILEQTITTLGGNVATSLQSPAMLSEPTDPEHCRFLIVPQTSQPDTHPTVPNEHIHIITEFYIENCLHNKRFFSPNEQVLGRPFPLFPIPGFSSMVICSATFTGIELNQVARSVTQLGGKYEEEFRRSTNVLVCKSLMSMRREKLKCALDWGVPVVSADWLWECISSAGLVPIEDYIYPEIKKRRVKRRDPFVNEEDEPAPAKEASQARKEKATPTDSEAKPTARTSKPTIGAGVDTTAFDKDATEKGRVRQHTLESITSADFMTAPTHLVESVQAGTPPPLSELSAAALNVSPKLPAAKVNVPRTISAPAKMPDSNRKEQSIPPALDPSPPLPPSAPEPLKASIPNPAPESTTKQTEEEQEAEKQRQLAAAEVRQGLTSALSDLIPPPPKSTSLSDNNHNQSDSRTIRRRRQKILGRAISNASNASSATSIDAVVPRVAAAALHDDDDEEHQQRRSPPATQLEYRDPEAMETKAMLMSRMTGAAEGATEVLGRTRSSARRK